jgi:hypothetical protein
MNCPNCERSVSALDRRCRVCHQRLPFWYVYAITASVVALAGILFLLEHL